MISAGGYAGIVVLMALESACLPLPSEIIMPFAGYLVSTGRFSLVLAATAGALGCNVGSAIAYWVGARGGRPLAERWGRFVLIDRTELDRVDRFFARFGGTAVFVGRLLPGIRTFIALPAGIARMQLVPFHIYTFVGSWPWCFGLAYVGLVLGERWNSNPTLRNAMRASEVVLAGVLLCLAAAYVVWRLRSRRRLAAASR